MKTAISCREAELGDYAAISAVRLAVTENRLSDPSKVTHADYIEYLTETGKGWVAEDAGRIAGFSIVNRSGLIWALFLQPGYEGRGIGKDLLARCLEWLKHIGVPRAFLDTDAGTRAELFYRRQGWREVSRNGTKLDFEIDL